MMKKVSYLTAPLVILALFVLGCAQGAPNASNGNEVVPKIDAPAVSSESVASSAETVGNPNGSCCPPAFFIVEAGPGNPANRNGDGFVCRKVTPGRTITIDNNSPGVCDCVPPNCQ